jgi:hypothetical protein
MAWTKKTSNTTPHNHQLVFGRREAGCPRCAELAGGAATVKGWGQERKDQERNLAQAIRFHNCISSKCGPVCTAFDW